MGGENWVPLDKKHFEREQAEYDAKMVKRQTRAAAGGKPPAAPAQGARADDPPNLTDEDSRIMKVGGGGFEQC
ncbi:hypothetical protein MASR2M16_16740 [Thauera terpenica]